MVIQQPQTSTEIPALDRVSIVGVSLSNENRLILEIVNRLVKEFNPENIFLFGSHAWGIPHSDSDLDLLVIVSNSDISSTRRSSIAYRCLRDIQYPLDILVKTRKEIENFSQVSFSLEHQILSRGKCLYGCSKRTCQELDGQGAARSTSRLQT